jgi:hypothetical protein
MSKPTLSEVIDHIRNRTYMGGVERDQLRVKATGEVFTPTELVREMLERIPIEQFQDPAKTFLDNSCGDGQFLGEVLIRKMENGSTFEQALSATYGVDLMQDNVDECRKRLLCGSQDPKHIATVEQNIYQADGLKFSYEFKPMSETRRKREQRHRRQGEKAKKVAEQAKIIEERKLKLFGKASAKSVKSKPVNNCVTTDDQPNV